MPSRCLTRDCRVVLLLLGVVTSCVGLAAQSAVGWQRTSVPALLEARQLEEVDGEKQWAEVAPETCAVCEGEKATPCRACRGGEHGAAKNCAECRGRGEAPCERCAGSGETLDPFIEMPCPACWSRALIPCQICLGVGRLDVTGGGTPSCPSCKAEGGVRCGLCRGTRKVDVLKAGRKPLHEAERDALAQLRERLDELREQVVVLRELAVRVRPRPAPSEFEEPLEELLAAAAAIERAWRGMPAQFRSLEDALERPRTGGIFSFRQVSNDDIRRLAYRQCAEGMLVWVDFHRSLIGRCRERSKKGR